MNDAPVKKRIVNMSGYRTVADDAQVQALLETYRYIWERQPLFLLNLSTRIPNPRTDPQGAIEAAKLMISTDEPATINAGHDLNDFVFMPTSTQAGEAIAA